MHIMLKSVELPLLYVMCKAVSCGSAWWSGRVSAGASGPSPALASELRALPRTSKGQRRKNRSSLFHWCFIFILQLKVLICSEHHVGMCDESWMCHEGSHTQQWPCIHTHMNKTNKNELILNYFISSWKHAHWLSCQDLDDEIDNFLVSVW